ncbi:MAG: hypothetical protein ACRDTH_14430 [Pseudonocardiaceae bacterium]
MSLAGPLTNLVLGAGLILVVGIGQLPDGFAAGLSYLALMQVLAAMMTCSMPDIGQPVELVTQDRSTITSTMGLDRSSV